MIEVLKQMVEALEYHTEQTRPIAKTKEAIQAGKQAIAELESQELVGWIDSKGNMLCVKINESCRPLYTTPPQRTWVGLTGEDVVKAYDDYQSGGVSAGFMGAVRAIEAKLKEKNT